MITRDGEPTAAALAWEGCSRLSMQTPADRECLRQWVLASICVNAPELAQTPRRQFRRRVLHFVPASQPKFLEKAASLGADTLVFDLEDSVSPEDKPAAREHLRALKRETFTESEFCIRVNALSSPHWAADVETVRAVKPDAVMLPKVESAGMLARAQEELGVECMPIIETIGGWQAADTIIGHSGIRTIVFGAEDFYSSFSVRERLRKGDIVNHPQDQARYLRIVQPLLLQCALRDVQFVDSVDTQIRNPRGSLLDGQELLRNECRLMRAEGALGKLSVHPSQIAIIRDGFDVSLKAVFQAVEKLESFSRTAVIVDRDGSMQDTPEIAAAKRILQDALRYL